MAAREIIPAKAVFLAPITKFIFAKLCSCLALALLLGVTESRGAIHAENLRRSDSFVVQDVRPAFRSPVGLPGSRATNIVELDPDVLVIVAERVRHALAQELGFATRRPGRMTLLLHGTSRWEEGQITIISSLLPQGWQMQANIPEQIDQLQLVRGLVQLNLLEVANRGAAQRSAQIPAWLIEGLSIHLLETRGPELVMSAVPSGVMVRNIRNVRPSDTLKGTREYFRMHRPLSFTELSQPGLPLFENRLELFQRTAHLFVHELLKSREGRTGLMRTLEELPHHLNWQTAFLRGFHPHFTRLLEVEKWWMVTTVMLGQRDPAMLWATEATLERLEQIRQVAAQVRVSADALPQRTELSLQQLISGWPWHQQKPVLNEKVALLSELRLAAPLEVIPLIDSYYVCLYGYLQRREAAATATTLRRPAGANTLAIVQDAVRQLDELDRQAAAMRAARAPAQTVATRP